MIIRGKAAVYNATNVFADNSEGILMPGCFDAWLRTGDKIPLCFEHRESLVIGEVITMRTSSRALHHVSRVYDTEAGRYIQKLIDAGVLDSFSPAFWFNAVKYSSLTEEGFYTTQKIGEVLRLSELSIVCMPGCSGAVMHGLKSKNNESVEQTAKRLEKFYDIGYGGKEAATINDIIYTKYRQWKDILFYKSLRA